jgi:hypothetical protein
VKDRWFGRAFACGCVAMLALASYVFAIEPSRLVVNRQELSLPNWPIALSGLRVMLLSDIHIGSPFWDLARERELVERANAEHPDLVLLGGDYSIDDVVGGRFVPIEPIAAELGKLRAPLGVIAVLGNHDWWNGGQRARVALEANGIKVLSDEVALLRARQTNFVVLGMADIEVRTRAPNASLDLAPPGLPLLALVHEPDVFAQMDGRPALTLAGHTHGGQVRLPFLGRPIVPSQYGQRYAAGQIVENGRHLFVTTGLGTSIWPVRFRVPPEIALLTLRSAAEAR